MTGSILALNCGSSSVRFAIFDEGLRPLSRGHVENIGSGACPRLAVDGEPPASLPDGHDSHARIIPHLIDEVVANRTGTLGAVGHRVVHGGTRFTGPVRIDRGTLAEIEALAPLAPAHQPHNLAGIEAVARALPDMPQVACFDTAFHRTIPEFRQLMALPRRFAEQGLRRFGFHGLSYEWIVSRLGEGTPGRMPHRAVICHLGNGCSLAGVLEGRSAWTSMGFTPLDGLMMGRRPGRLDPGAVLWLVGQHGGDAGAVDRLLNRDAGLLGVSGLSPDMRTLLADGGEGARLAINMFVDRLVQEIAAAAAALEGLDALVFTGGIGENAAPIRAAVTNALGWLGFALDDARNDRHASTITTPSSTRSAHVIATDEEAVIAGATRRLTGSAGRQAEER